MKKWSKYILASVSVLLLSSMVMEVNGEIAPYRIPFRDASYPGGQDSLIADLERLFEYTEEARRAKISGRIQVLFVVTEQGTIEDVQVTRGLGYGLDERAVAAIQKLRRFRPALKDGKPVRTQYTIPIQCMVIDPPEEEVAPTEE